MPHDPHSYEFIQWKVIDKNKENLKKILKEIKASCMYLIKCVQNNVHQNTILGSTKHQVTFKNII